jgi:hypothetical protein
MFRACRPMRADSEAEDETSFTGAMRAGRSVRIPLLDRQDRAFGVVKDLVRHAAKHQSANIG